MSSDLCSWRGLPADPPVREKMSRDGLAIAQFAADGRMREHWRVIDEAGERVLAFDGRGDNLCTRGVFEDFELELEWRIGPKGDSGIYLRGTPLGRRGRLGRPVQQPEAREQAGLQG